MQEDQSRDDSSASSPDLFPPENHDNSVAHDGGLTHHIPGLGTVIPNRIFVRGIEHNVNESDLRRVFSQHGAVTEVKIVLDRSGASKGYGFVTFENQDDALKILRDANGVSFKDKKLFIGQAVRRQQAPGQRPVSCSDPATPLLTSCGTEYLTTSTGFPYTYHNGVAYFHCLNLSPPAHHWPQAAPPVILPQSPQPVYQQPACHYYQTPSSPVMYPQQSEYLCPPADGGSAPLPLPDTPAEFSEAPVQQVYRVCPLRAEGMPPFVLQRYPATRLCPLSCVHLKPRGHRYVLHQEPHPRPETSEPVDASVLHSAPPLM